MQEFVRNLIAECEEFFEEGTIQSRGQIFKYLSEPNYDARSYL